METDPRQRPCHASHQRHRPGLDQVDHKDLARGGSQAAQHRDGFGALPDENHRRARHTDAPKQQRDEGDEAQIPGELGEDVVEIPLILGDSPHPDLLGRERRPVTIRQRLGRDPGRQLEECFVLNPGSETEQPGLLQIFRRDVHSRPEGETKPHVARRALDCARDHETRLAERDGISQSGTECREQGRINNDMPAGL